jgi:glycosyltransferase involved in cell wall biosynthesis
MLDVSVIMPTYNCCEFIGEAISSVQAQSCRSLELIVVDDGSTDGTAAALPALPFLRYLSRPRGGPSAARNTGLRAARGRYVAFLDADDLWEPGSLDRRLAFATSHPELGLVFGDASFFSDDGLVRASHLAPKTVFRRVPSWEPVPGCHLFRCLVSDELMIEPFIATDTVVMRRDCLDETGFFDESMWIGEDIDLWYRVARSFPVGYLDEIVARCRARPGSVTSDPETVAQGLVRSMVKSLEYYRGGGSSEVRRSLRRRLGRYLVELGELHASRGRLGAARRCFLGGLRCPSARRSSGLRLVVSLVGCSSSTLRRRLTHRKVESAHEP